MRPFWQGFNAEDWMNWTNEGIRDWWKKNEGKVRIISKPESKKLLNWFIVPTMIYDPIAKIWEGRGEFMPFWKWKYKRKKVTFYTCNPELDWTKEFIEFRTEGFLKYNMAGLEGINFEVISSKFLS